MAAVPAFDPREVVVGDHEVDAAMGTGNEAYKDLVLLQLLLVFGVAHCETGTGGLAAGEGGRLDRGGRASAFEQPREPHVAFHQLLQ
jgi:hypothetical protein